MQNCRIGGSEYPSDIVEKPCHPQRLADLVQFLVRRSHWTLLFENAAGARVTVNELRYREMIFMTVLDDRLV